MGLPLEMEGKLYNTAAVLHDGKILAFVPKATIPNYGEFYEVRHFAAGRKEAETILSVSYTHLDVYKRQALYTGIY